MAILLVCYRTYTQIIVHLSQDQFLPLGGLLHTRSAGRCTTLCCAGSKVGAAGLAHPQYLEDIAAPAAQLFYDYLV